VNLITGYARPDGEIKTAQLRCYDCKATSPGVPAGEALTAACMYEWGAPVAAKRKGASPTPCTNAPHCGCCISPYYTLNHPGRLVPCKKCGGGFPGPKVNTMAEAEYVQGDQHNWDRIKCKIQCDDCGNETALWAVGYASAWEQWIAENKDHHNG